MPDKIEILYFGVCVGEKIEDNLIQSQKVPYYVAQSNLEKSILRELFNDVRYSVSAYAMPSAGYGALTRGIFVRSSASNFKNGPSIRTIGFLNVPLVKYLLYPFTMIKIYIRWLKSSKKSDKLVYVSANYVPISLILVLLSRLFKIHIVCMFCDLSRDIFSAERVSQFSFIKRSIMGAYIRVVKYVEHSFSGYVLLSNAMDSEVNVHHKPSCVMEGMYNYENDFPDILHNKSNKKKILMYSGTLFDIYGIQMLLDVFSVIKDDSFELWIFGDGECRGKVEAASSADSRVKYFGFVTKQRVVEAMRLSTLILNLRDPSLDYTRYSFPSKMFESMASGSAVYTTKLDGIPDEYYRYVYVAKKYDVNVIADDIVDICSDVEGLKKIGREARDFILSEKNPCKQASIIKKLINKVVKYE